MFGLRLSAKQCTSCGICMDVCPPRAISMRTKVPRTVEGDHIAIAYLDSGPESVAIEGLMTFPWMSSPKRCDGCGLCVQQCPCLALELVIADPLPECPAESETSAPV